MRRSRESDSRLRAPRFRLAMPLVLLAILAATAVPGAVHAATYVVHPDGSGDYATIQEAVNACADGDTIELGDGMFTGEGNRDISWQGKHLVIRSQSGDADACVIDCEGGQTEPHRAFVIEDGDGSSLVLENLTLRSGYASGHGGAVHFAG
ncbi:MAG: hypothetical protein GF330_08275, partial [Candidatus Eisenbacteria bacterium]|nr:hypothetical protein [Candidatus Eisenbacteria bacterium]